MIGTFWLLSLSDDTWMGYHWLSQQHTSLSTSSHMKAEGNEMKRRRFDSQNAAYRNADIGTQFQDTF